MWTGPTPSLAKIPYPSLLTEFGGIRYAYKFYYIGEAPRHVAFYRTGHDSSLSCEERHPRVKTVLQVILLLTRV